MMGKKVSPRRVVFIYNVHELHCLENTVTVLITKVIPDAHSNTHTHTHTHSSVTHGETDRFGAAGLRAAKARGPSEMGFLAETVGFALKAHVPALEQFLWPDFR